MVAAHCEYSGLRRSTPTVTANVGRNDGHYSLRVLFMSRELLQLIQDLLTIINFTLVAFDRRIHVP